MRTILYDNSNIDYTGLYEEFKSYCIDNGIDYTKYPNDSTYFFEWVDNLLLQEWEDFEHNISYSEDGKQECVVLGSLGLWYGECNIKPKKFDNLLKAILTCIRNIDYVQISFEDGRINVNSIHHDGTNSFSIYKLNKKGRNIVDTDKLNNKNYHAKYKL